MSPNVTREEVQKRVYDREVSGEGTFRIVGEHGVMRVRETEADARVDDISDEKVALVTFSDEPEASGYIRLGPDEARELVKALTAAAEYADD